MSQNPLLILSKNSTNQISRKHHPMLMNHCKRQYYVIQMNQTVRQYQHR